MSTDYKKEIVVDGVVYPNLAAACRAVNRNPAYTEASFYRLAIKYGIKQARKIACG